MLGGRLAPDPSIAALATAARLGLTDAGPLPYAQDTSLGVPVVPGVLSAERFRALRSLWPQVADELAAWAGTAIVDLGRLSHDHPAMPVARASTVVLLLTPATLEGLYHVRDRVAELSGALGDPARTRPNLGVVVTGEVRDRRSSCGAGAAGVGVHRFPGPGDRVRRPRPGRRRGVVGGGADPPVRRQRAGQIGPGDGGVGAGRLARTAPGRAAGAVGTATAAQRR